MAGAGTFPTGPWGVYPSDFSAHTSYLELLQLGLSTGEQPLSVSTEHHLRLQKSGNA